MNRTQTTLFILLISPVLLCAAITLDNWSGGYTAIEDSLFLRKMASQDNLKTSVEELSIPADLDAGKYVFIHTTTFSIPQDLEENLFITTTPTDYPYRVFVNDRLVMVQGDLNSILGNHLYKADYQILNCNCLRRGKNRIIVETYPRHIKSGFVSVSIKNYKEAHREVFTHSFFSYTFLAALATNIFVIAFFFFAFYFASDRRRTEYLFFALTSIAIAGGASNIIFSFSSIYDVYLWKFARICLTLSPVMLLLFQIYYNHLEDRLKYMRYFLYTLLLIYVPMLLFQGDRRSVEVVFSHIVNVLITPSFLAITLLALRSCFMKKRIVDVLILIGSLVVIAAGMHDVYFYNNHRIPYVWLTLYGYLFLEVTIMSALIYDMVLLFRHRKEQADLIEERNLQLQKQSDIIKQMSHEKHELLKNMAHEFKTPLQGILATSELLKKSPESTLESIEQIMDGLNIQMQKHLFNIENVIDYSIFENDVPEIVQGSFDLLDFVSSLKLIFQHNEYNLESELVVTLDDDIPKKYYGCERQLRRILLGLITNINKKSGSSVWLRVHWNDVSGLLTFSMGCKTGFEESTHDLLSRYVDDELSFHDTSSIDELAVAVAKRLITLINARLLITPGALELSVPVERVQEVDRVSLDDSTILVVEDNKVNRLLICKILERLGYQTIVAENGLKAIEMVLAYMPRLILMDIQMPIMDGITATQKIRELLPDNSTMAIVALTANASPIECFSAGMNDFLPKPVTIEQIKGVLDRLPELSGKVDSHNTQEDSTEQKIFRK